MIAPLSGVISDRHDVLLADADATHKLIPLDKFLQHHAKRAGLVIGPDQFFDGVHLVDILPTAAPGIFENRRQPHIVDNDSPIERIDQIAQALADHAFDILFRGQHDGFGRGQPQAR